MKIRSLRRFLLIVSLVLGGNLVAQESELSSLVTAREDFNRDFVRELSVIQRKYSDALSLYKRKFTTAGDLNGAKEADLELRMANEWETIPPTSRIREFTNEELKNLLPNYEKAAGFAVEAVVTRYLDKLNYLKRGYASRNDLNALKAVEKAIELASLEKGLPRAEGAKSYLSSLSQDDFHEWLKRQKFRFAGTSAGVTNVWIENDQLQYHPVDQALAKGYAYFIKGNRSVDIGNGNFEMMFSKDLQSATFKSGRGEYPIEINPEN